MSVDAREPQRSSNLDRLMMAIAGFGALVALALLVLRERMGLIGPALTAAGIVACSAAYLAWSQWDNRRAYEYEARLRADQALVQEARALAADAEAQNAASRDSAA